MNPIPNHPDASLDDAAVIARVLGGDKQQFALLVARYQTGLYRHAVSMVLDHDVAADMVQETLVRAYTRLSTCRDHDRFRAWIFQMLRNRCLDHLKDVRRRNVSLDRALDVPDPADEPVRQMERARLRGEIARALEQLPDAQREAFLMHYVEELPYETMADLLGASVSALKMRVLRARDTLGAALRNKDVTVPAPVRLLFRRTTMKAFFAIAITTLLTAGALPAFAQGGQNAQERIDAAIAHARSQGVPVSLLESKMAEGKAKGVSLDRIAAAIERREASLERAAQAMKGAEPITDADLSVGADAVDAGVSNAVLKAVTDSAPRERRAVAIAALTELVQRGTAPDAALARVRDALKRGPDALAAVGADRGEARGNAGAARGGEARGRGAAEGPPANVPAPGGTSQPRKPSTPNAPANPGSGRSGK
jgi:RNA polymerase sigma-70 factor (ECF subfamily)